MSSTAILAIRIISDATKAARELNGLGDSTSKWASRTETAGRAANKVIGGFAVMGAAAFKYASDLQQSTGAVESVFKKQAGAVEDLATKASQSVGLATSEYNELAAVLGAQLGNMGVAQGKLVGTTDSLIKSGADLAATFGGTTKEAVEALSSALRGETDPIERYGISIKEATIQAELAAKGQDKLTGKALQAAKTQALLSLVAKQGAAAQGAFAREADTAAGAQQRAMASAKNAAAALGTALLPIVADLAGWLTKLATFISENDQEFKVIAATILGVAVAVKVAQAAIVAYTVATKVVAAATKVWTGVQAAFNVVAAMNPVTLIVIAVIALVAAIVIAYKKSETFRNIVQAVGRACAKAFGWVVDKVSDLVGWVKNTAPKAFAFLKTAATTYLKVMTFPIRTLIRWIGDLVGWVKDKAINAWLRLKYAAVTVWGAITDKVRPLIDKVRDLIDWVRVRVVLGFRIMKAAAMGPIRAIRDAFGWVVDKVQAVINKVQELISWIKDIPSVGIDVPGGRLNLDLGKVFGQGGGTSAGRMSSDTNVFNISGALDADSTARQIERLQRRMRRRRGRR